MNSRREPVITEGPRPRSTREEPTVTTPLLVANAYADLSAELEDWGPREGADVR